ncbi:MAG TPA: DUF2007 domain-containing protein [Acidobacteriaceae bacterium]|jgi:hypothetical protein|nr:DUF2007 domain-containing protein [Acidobacteriaceae bacterium]
MSEQSEQRDRLIDEAAESPAENLVTVSVFPDPMTANMARMALESAGITSFMHGENANSLLPVAFAARLQVRPEDEAAARALLEQADNAPDSEESVTAAEMAAEGEAS